MKPKKLTQQQKIKRLEQAIVRLHTNQQQIMKFMDGLTLKEEE